MLAKGYRESVNINIIEVVVSAANLLQWNFGISYIKNLFKTCYSRLSSYLKVGIMDISLQTSPNILFIKNLKAKITFRITIDAYLLIQITCDAF